MPTPGAAGAAGRAEKHLTAPGAAAAKGAAHAGAMLSPLLDAICVGGGSILMVVALIVFDVRVPAEATIAMAAAGFLLNAPHFMASYRLLYGDAERRRSYRRVSIFIPAALMSWMVFALVQYPNERVYLEAMLGAAGVLLAWHYTGQTWGMMSAFGFIAGLRFEPRERRLVRVNLYVLLVWHALWAITIVRKLFATQADGIVPLGLSAELVHDVYATMSVAALASSLLGAAGLVLLARRTGRAPTLRMLLPWVAVHTWYLLMYREPAALFWVQIAHASQYLIFPLRVEINRRASHKRAHGSRQVLVYFVALVGLGLLFMGIVPDGLGALIRALGLGSIPLTMGVVAFINIHHYYIDNVIWKIRNPIVRYDLFAHLQPVTNPTRT